MNKIKYLIASFLLIAQLSYAQENEAISFSAKWDNGFKIESSDGSFKLKFGGRIMYDAGFYSLDDEGKSNGYTLKATSGNELRRARIFMSGNIYQNVGFKLQLDFAGGRTVIKDAFITIKKIPIAGNFRVGHFKEPMRLEALTSSKYITFMERALLSSILFERNSGFMVYNNLKNNRMSWQVGLFRGVNKATSDNPTANSTFALTTRVAGTIFQKDNTLLHLGLANRYKKAQDPLMEVSLRPGSHNANKYMKISVDGVENLNTTVFETALVANSFSVQGEYSHTKVNSSIEDKTFDGFYAQASYFLTGEKRNYKNSFSGFDRVKPFKNFGKNGMGAIELAIRYSEMNGLNNDKLNVITSGVNWHLNPATRIMANYVISNIDNKTIIEGTNTGAGKGQFSAFQMRFQIDF